MKLCKRVLACTLSLAMIMGLSVSAPAQAKKTKTAIKAKKINVEVGSTAKIRLKNKKKKAVYTYQATKKKIATVSKKGVVKGIKKGKTTVRVYEKTKKKKLLGTVTVTVKAKKKAADSKATQKPTLAPKATEVPTTVPTTAPTTVPTTAPTTVPTTAPTTVPTTAPTADVSELKALNLSKYTSKGDGTVTYDSAADTLHAVGVSYFHVPLPETLTSGSQVHVKITGTDNGTKGFRAWLAASQDANFSEIMKSTDSNVAGDFVWEFDVTAADSVSTLEFKGSSYDSPIEDLLLSKVEVSYVISTEPVPTAVPMPTDLPSNLITKNNIVAEGTHAAADIPLIYSDVPDMDYIRVGNDYYMVSTTMFLNPGVPIMHSKDLVHWEIVSYVYDTLEDNDTTNLLNGQECYSNGSWAASLRYHDGTYYVCFSSNDQKKFYIYTTDDIEKGTWKKHSASGTKHDPGMIFDDGKLYITSGNGNITIQEVTLSGDSIRFGTATSIIKKTAASNIVNIEGSHIYKIGDYYYLFFIEWPGGGKRMQWCYRSKSLTSGWEGKVVFCDDAGLNGAGVAQGGIIDTQNGDWYAMLFQDHGAIGRTPVLLEVYWVDAWPILGSNGGKASATAGMDVNLTSEGENKIWGDDDFAYDTNKLSLLWQWNHNPDNANWSVTERAGYLRLTTGTLATSIMNARNSLTQRTYGPSCTSEVSMDVTNMKNGDFSGICAFQKNYGQVGVMKDETGKTYVYYGTSNTDTMTVKDANKVALDQSTVSLRIQYNFKSNTAAFAYSLDGSTWTKIGGTLTMTYDLSIFMGYRTYLYNYATTQTGGSVDFDYYKIY